MMKILPILFFLCSHVLIAQGNIDYGIQVLDQNKKPVANLKIHAIETSTLAITEGTTDNAGTLEIQLKKGKEWVINIGEIEKAKYLNAIPYAETQIGEIYIYDLEAHKRKQTQLSNRNNFSIQKMDAGLTETSFYSDLQCMIIVKMVRPNGSPLADIEVGVANANTKTLYTQTTKKDGKAIFIVPNNANYDIDAGALLNYSYVDFGNETKQTTLNIEFEPSIVTEKIKKDTIAQSFSGTPSASSDRALIKINVTGGKKNGSNETVYVRDAISHQVYSATTNAQGSVYFLLPVKKIYMIDMMFEKDIDGINLSNAGEMTSGEINIKYKPDPRLENPQDFLPTPDRIFIRHFNTFLTKQFEKPKSGPLSLKFISVKDINKDSREALYKITLTTASDYGTEDRVPVNVALVIDKSGSMYAEGRDSALKTALATIIPLISEKDKIWVVMFDEQCYTVKGTTGNKELLKFVVANYMPGGGTDILHGLEMGSKNILTTYQSDKINKVILLTDGYDSNPPEDVINLVKTGFSQGIEFSTIGIGQSYNQALLELIADNGHGSFKHVSNPSMLIKTFADEMHGSLNFVAKDILIEVSHDPSMVFLELYGYPVRDVTSTGFKIELSKLAQDINEIAFLKFKLDKPDKTIESKPITVKVKYYDMVLKKTVAYTESISLKWTESTNIETKLDQEEQKLYAIAIMNQFLKVMSEAVAKKDFKTARLAVLSGIEQTNAIFPNTKPEEINALFKEAETYITLLDRIK